MQPYAQRPKTLESSPRSTAELTEALRSAWTWTDRVFDTVSPDAMISRPVAERHRLLFYVGHLEAFDRNLLASVLPLGASPEPTFDPLFAFGIDPLDGDTPTDQPSDWPSLEHVARYAARCRRAFEDALTARDASEDAHERLLAAVEHRLMHAETLVYLVHQLPSASKRAPGDLGVPRAAGGDAPQGRVVIPRGSVVLGAAHGEHDFVWDNEREAHAVDVPAFAIDRLPTTNARFLDFVEAGGYDARELWTAEDWAWIQSTGRKHPHFWATRGGGWVLRSLFEERPLPRRWPVYVSHAEARAFARWVGARLPTEAEWQRAAYGAPGEDAASTPRAYPWDTDQALPANADRALWEPTDVDAHPEGKSAFGVLDLLGNGWEWTSTPFAPFTGFEARSYYPGYSANFFDGRHFILKGGSPHTARRLLRRSFRNWFQPHYPHVYATFRCVAPL